MGYQIITHSDNYYVDANEETYNALFSDIKWVRNTELGILPVKSDTEVMQDPSGFTHTVNMNYEPVDPARWQHIEKKLMPITQFQVMDEISGKFRLLVNYVSNHTYLIEITVKGTDHVLAREVPASFEPRFGVDAVDMENILRTAEELCLLYESGEYQEFLKVE